MARGLHQRRGRHSLEACAKSSREHLMLGTIVFLHNGQWVLQKKRTAMEGLRSPPSSPKLGARSLATRVETVKTNSDFNSLAVICYHFNVLKKKMSTRRTIGK